MQSLYEKDFHEWSIEQANLLKNGDYDHLDFENLIEEIESLGKSDKRSLESCISLLLMHLLKIKYQPERHTRSWDITVGKTKTKILRLIKKNPSFKRFIPEIMHESYEDARKDASYETNLDIKKFPKKCPWTFEEITKE